jgi:hypothetical protein
MNRDLLHSRAFQLAAATLVLAVGVVTWTAVRAMQIVPVAEAAPPVFATDAAMAKIPPRGPYDITAVVGVDVFAPERTAPARRYRLGGYEPERPSSPPPQPLVLGTSVADDANSFAICRVAGGPATIVRIGSKIGAFTVFSIERGLVVFTGPTGEKVTVKAATP